MNANKNIYRSAIVFEQTPPPKEPAPELTAQRQFEENNVRFSLANLDKETLVETEVETVIQPKKEKLAFSLFIDFRFRFKCLANP